MEGFSIANEFLPTGSPCLGLVCLFPLYIAVARAETTWRSFLAVWLQVLVVHLISGFWLANFHGFAIITMGLSSAMVALIGGLCGIIFHAFPRDRNFPGRNGSAGRIIWFSICWTFYEYIKSTGTLGYPWGTVFSTSYSWRIVAQIADITGVWGITFLFALSSSVAAEFTLSLTRPPLPARRHPALECIGPLKACCALFILASAYGSARYFIPPKVEKRANLVLVQQNADPWQAGDKNSIRVSKKLTLEGIESLKERGTRPDLVVWSEGVLSRPFPGAAAHYWKFPEDESLCEFIQNCGVPFIIGGETAIDRHERKYANSAILFDSEGKYSGFYSKIHLVPAAERIPFEDTFPVRWLKDEFLGGFGGLTPGFQFVSFRIPLVSQRARSTPLDFGRPPFASIELDSEGKAAPATTALYESNEIDSPRNFLRFTTPICFEDAFSDVCSRLHSTGSEIFINITNDSWSRTRSAEIQHFIIASFLAIEFRTTLARCANSGCTVVIDPRGRLLSALPLFEEKALAVTVPICRRERTVFSEWGDWFALINCACALLYVALQILRVNFGGRIREMKSRLILPRVTFGECEKEIEEREENKIPAAEKIIEPGLAGANSEKRIEAARKTPRKKPSEKTEGAPLPARRGRKPKAAEEKNAAEEKPAAKKRRAPAARADKPKEEKAAAKKSAPKKAEGARPATRKAKPSKGEAE